MLKMLREPEGIDRARVIFTTAGVRSYHKPGMKIILLADSGEELQKIEDVESMELTVKKTNGDFGHTSQLSFQDHIKSLILSWDSLAVKSAKLSEVAEGASDPALYREFYQKMYGLAHAHKRELEAIDHEMARIARRELGEEEGPEPEQTPEAASESN